MLSSAVGQAPHVSADSCEVKGWGREGGRTFEQLAPVYLARRDLESDDMALQKNCSVSGGSEQAL